MKRLSSLITLILVSGCASSGIKMDSGTTMQVAEPGSKDLAIHKSGAEGYFILIDENNNSYTVNKISKQPLQRENTKQEVLFINKDFSLVVPAYEFSNVKHQNVSGTTNYSFACNKELIESPKYNTMYNPCNSKLVTRHWLYDYVRNMDKKKILNIISDTGMIEKIKKMNDEYTGIKNVASGFIFKINIEPQIIDKSGLYSGEKVVNVSKTIVESSIGSDINQTKYLVSIRPSQPHYTLEINPQSYDLNYNSEGYTLKPTINVIEKQVNGIVPDAIFKDSSLSVNIRKITAVGGAIKFEFDVENISEKYLTIENLSFYIDSSILTPSMAKIELPPKSVKNDIALYQNRNISETKIFDSAKDALKRTVSKESAEKTIISIGISTKYIIDGNKNSLYKTNTYKFAQIMQK